MDKDNEDYIMAFVHERAKHFRLKNNVKQEYVAQILGLSRASYINVEKRRHSLRLAYLYTLACLYKVELSEFFPPLQELKLKEKITKKRIVKVKVKEVLTVKPVKL